MKSETADKLRKLAQELKTKTVSDLQTHQTKVANTVKAATGLNKLKRLIGIAS